MSRGDAPTRASQDGRGFRPTDCPGCVPQVEAGPFSVTVLKDPDTCGLPLRGSQDSTLLRPTINLLDHVSRLLKALDWTPQKPMERAAQRDEEKIIAWREETWPDLKKSAGFASNAGLY